MAQATLTSKGQVTIPALVRASMGVGTGDRIEFVEVGKGQYTIISATQSVKVLKGIIGKPARPVSIDEMNAAIGAAQKSGR
jgi:AbrB family looped-hinge helix DNA binding protein